MFQSALLHKHLQQTNNCLQLWLKQAKYSANSRSQVCFHGAVILAQNKVQGYEQGIDMYQQIEKACVDPSVHNFVAVLKACGNLAAVTEGKMIHAYIIESGFEPDIYVENNLVDMYSKCGNIDDAHQVFDRLSNRDVVTWNTIITGYAQHGHGQVSLCHFKQMQQSPLKPNRVTFVCVLKACSSMRALGEGKLIHAGIIENGFDADIRVGNILVDMYAKCSSLQDAHQVFDRLPKRDVVTWSAMISGLCQDGLGEEALHLFQKMQEEGLESNRVISVCGLRACSLVLKLNLGKWIHAQIMDSGFDLNISVGNTLVDMYAKCGSLKDAHEVFMRLLIRDVVTWSAMIAGFACHGNEQKVFQVFQQMLYEGMEPNKVTFVSILKACSSTTATEEGKHIHNHIIRAGVDLELIIGNTLVDMYAKCGSIKEARMVFDRLSNRDAVSWSAMIAGYAQHVHYEEVLSLFLQMQESGFLPNQITYVSILKLCSNIESLDQGKQIHSHGIEHGFESAISVANSLINMYIKCESLKDAQKVFERLVSPDVVSWSAIISGYAQSELGEEAFECFQQMQQLGIEPNKVTFVSMLKACSIANDCDDGRLIHSHMIEYGLEADVLVANTFINTYAKGGCLEDAVWVFERLLKRDVVTWSVMIAGYAQHGFFAEAFYFFLKMQQEGMKPNHATFVSILKACSTRAALDLCKIIHTYITKDGFDYNALVVNNLIDMYGRCRSVEDAFAVFERVPKRDVVTWSTMIAILSGHGHAREALQIFGQMQQEGFEPNQVTFLCALKACSLIGALEQGEMIHAHIYKSGLKSDVSLGNTLIDMYCKCGTLMNAQSVFDKLPSQDVVTWSALIAGYIQHGHSQEALHLFDNMLEEGVEPNDITFMSILKACSAIAALDQGKAIHAHAIERAIESDVIVGSALIDMYTKCESFENAHWAFARLQKRSATTWSSMIVGFAQHNDYKMAWHYFEGMLKEGLMPDDVTFLALLSACNHIGLVNEALHLFTSMREEHGITPSSEHYNSIIDLLGRTGCLKEAGLLLETMPFEPSMVALTSLLGHCRTHGNIDLGRECFQDLSTIDGRNAAGYMLMSNVYARADQQEEADGVEDLRKCANAWKKPGKAFIEVNNTVFDFVVADKSHPQHAEIYLKLQRFSLQMKKEGYLPQWGSLPQPISDEDRDDD